MPKACAVAHELQTKRFEVGRVRHAAAGRAHARRKGSFLADQRGAVAFETLIVYSFMVTALLLPLADVAAAGFQFISAWEALRVFRAICAVPSAS